MRSRRPAVLAGALVVLVLLGCGMGGVTRSSGPAAPPAASPARSAGASVDGTDTVEEFTRDIDGAREIAERYWAKQVTGFSPVRRIVPYTRDRQISCGGTPLGLNNAAYCSAGDFIAYDANWAFAAFRQVGDAFLFYLLGHEYAHGIQQRLGIQQRFTIQMELQADCMAGAYIGDSARSKDLTLQDGDVDELQRGLEAVADDPGQPWFAEGSHGSARQRTQAFADGYNSSLKACNLT